MLLEICMQIYSVVFALSRQINKQKVCENNLLAKVIKFLQNIKPKVAVSPKLPRAYTFACGRGFSDPVCPISHPVLLVAVSGRLLSSVGRAIQFLFVDLTYFMAETVLQRSSALFGRNLSVWEACICGLISRISLQSSSSLTPLVLYIFIKNVMLVPTKISSVRFTSEAPPIRGIVVSASASVLAGRELCCNLSVGVALNV